MGTVRRASSAVACRVPDGEAAIDSRVDHETRPGPALSLGDPRLIRELVARLKRSFAAGPIQNPVPDLWNAVRARLRVRQGGSARPGSGQRPPGNVKEE